MLGNHQLIIQTGFQLLLTLVVVKLVNCSSTAEDETSTAQKSLHNIEENLTTSTITPLQVKTATILVHDFGEDTIDASAEGVVGTVNYPQPEPALVSNEKTSAQFYDEGRVITTSPTKTVSVVGFENYVRTDEQRLLYYLLQSYDKNVRPVRNASTVITVSLGLTLTNILDLNEKTQVLQTNVWIDQGWKDELLRWDPDLFGGLVSIRIPCEMVWIPDIVLYNNEDEYTTGYMKSRAMVYHDGSIFWSPAARLRSTCKIDVSYFPFDYQWCFLKFGSWAYHGYEVDVTNRSENVDLSNYVINGEFHLAKTYLKRRVIRYACCPEPYPDVTFFLHLKRKTLYYWYNHIMPCMMMSLLAVLVFCLPPDSGEKVGLGITVLLSYTVFVLSVAEKMPETSESTPLIAVYMLVVMNMTSLSVFMTVFILNLNYKTGMSYKQVPHWVQWLVLDKLRRFLCLSDETYPSVRLRTAGHSVRRRSLQSVRSENSCVAIRRMTNSSNFQKLLNAKWQIFPNHV